VRCGRILSRGFWGSDYLFAIMETYLTQFICSLLGCVLGSGGIIGLLFYLQKRKMIFSETLFSEYKNISQELVEILQDLLSLSFIPSKYTDEQLCEISENLSAFYFKYYLVLPQTVLLEIQSLYSSIYRKGDCMFLPVYDKKMKIYVQRKLSSEKEQIDFIKDTSLVLRNSVESIIRFYKIHPERIADTFLKCQARHVITVLDREWNLKNMHKWSKHTRKTTLCKRERNKWKIKRK